MENVKYIIVKVWRRKITDSDIKEFKSDPKVKRYDTYEEAKKVMDKAFYDDCDYGIFKIDE